ncbi:Adhesion G-protein coupled receptor G7 [Nibea albiflora]|uniref:Adhesion G-protein coupled receptor G7 n=1 Tax=Nibea albiflora TaxID=240163 RepID=A0ACB7ERG1_NIBAL|nr:Adhesion G-protein coupled receptor G7 [Nibea albiflora]
MLQSRSMLKTNSIPDSDERVEPDHGSCSAVVALLHFLLLATFMWSSVYTTQLVLLIRTMSRSLPPYWKKLSLAIGWGVPAIVMAITLGATYRVDNPLGYRQEEFTSHTSLKKKFLISFFSLAVLLGLSWTLGYLVLLTTGYTPPDLQHCPSASGFQIFILFTARKPSFRAAVSRSMEYVSTIRIQLKDQTYSLTKNSGSKE